MAYTKTVWAERVGTFLNRFTKSNETTTSVELVNNPVIETAGTAFSPTAMNNLEDQVKKSADITDLVIGSPTKIWTDANDGNGGQPPAPKGVSTTHVITWPGEVSTGRVFSASGGLYDVYAFYTENSTYFDRVTVCVETNGSASLYDHVTSGTNMYITLGGLQNRTIYISQVSGGSLLATLIISPIKYT